jgi:hypothetical protein
MYTLLELESKTFGELKKIGYELNVFPEDDRRYRQSWIDALVGVNPPLLQLLEVSPAVEVDRAQEPIIEAVESFPAAEAEQAQEPPIESKFGRIVYPRSAQEAIVQAAKNTPGAEVDPVGELLPDCVVCFGDKFIEDSSGRIFNCAYCTEPKVSQSAIAPAVEKSPGFDCVYCHAPEYESLRNGSYRCYKCQPETDQNPILTGLTFSAGFLARYSPPQSEIVHFQSDADGQLSLLDFEVESVDEPPDPDDFESLDAFRETIARWDWEHPSSFDHCSDQLPRSEDNDVSSEDKALELSLDSFCLWAHCPADWYEPATLLEPSKVRELSQVCKSSITSEFFILTFDHWGDRSNRSDEPPDTGIFARLPKPKPPTFPPQASQPKSAQVSPNQARSTASQPGIPKLFHRVAAGSRTQPARSPPGGDAMP